MIFQVDECAKLGTTVWAWFESQQPDEQGIKQVKCGTDILDELLLFYCLFLFFFFLIFFMCLLI